MTKLIITKGSPLTNILIELKDGSQVEMDVLQNQLLNASNNDEVQTVIEVNQ
ncbi:hypothetical protein [Paenibacillus sp. Root52]|uniref:hypothetical protein n=1 Tax=Paenibacillus sp. Root52 TaxID=1736552 RepID=UPI000B19C8DB|nr:hypothetical protein [Paenibacillus sp. Root52]